MKQKQISFRVTKADAALIAVATDRAFRMAAEARAPYPSRMDCQMDLTATHANGCRLNLPKLLAFDDFNFSHDVFGIRRHLDRTTGKLGGCFLPRCAQPAHPRSRRTRELMRRVEAERAGQGAR